MADSLQEEAARKAEKPVLGIDRAISLARELYGLDVVPGSVKELDSYDDRNFYFRATVQERELLDSSDCNSAADGAYHFVLKIHNGIESRDPSFIECQNAAMDAVRCSSIGVWCPRALASREGSKIPRVPSELVDGSPREHAARCFPYRPGALLAQAQLSLELLHNLGAATAGISASLMQFDHPAAHRSNFIWDLAHADKVRPLMVHSPPDRHPLLCSVLDEFESLVLPSAQSLRKAVIHGDVNDQNVLVDADGRQILGILDFGDMNHSWLINEIAIATAYAIIARYYTASNESPGTHCIGLSAVDIAVALTSSYNAKMTTLRLPITAVEWSVLPTLIACRITVSLIIGAYSSAQDPTNEYLKLTLLPGWTALQNLRTTPARQLTSLLMEAACALTATPDKN